MRARRHSDRFSGAKPSRPSRAYFHLTGAQHLRLLADKIRSTQFIDSKGTFNDAVLLGPPVLVTTPFSRVPPKARSDGRQGTIDQDPEFIDFLASLTTPVARPANIDAIADKEKLMDAKMITPLVQYIKDKKANKGKEAKAQKHGRQESKDNPAKSEDKKIVPKNTKGKAPSTDKKVTVLAKAEKIKQKRSTKAVEQSILPPPVTAAQESPAVPLVTQGSVATQPKPERRRERGNASIAAQILQRDLGLVDGGSGRRKRNIEASANNPSPQVAVSPVATPPTPVASASTPSALPSSVPSSVPAQAPTAPATTRKAQSQNNLVQQRRPAPTKPSSVVSSTATQAFLKHANPSQGVTEPLLEEAFRAFGNVVKVEIDKKKGFAYIDFAEPTGLQKAIASSPVKVGQGQVVVLERKVGAVLQNRNARGPQETTGQAPPNNRGGRGGGRGRGGKNSANQSKPPNVVASNATAPTPVTAPT